MSGRRLIAESLIHHWRSHVAMLLCVAVGTSVLGGALLVGDSMRGSLRDITLDRLGRIDYAMSPGRLFPGDLGMRLRAAIENSSDESSQKLVGDRIEPVLLLRGTVSRVDESNQETSRAGRVQICGVTRSFWELGRSGTAPQWASDWATRAGTESIVVNEQLAHDIGAAVGDTVLIRVEKPSEIPRESALGRKDDPFDTIRVAVSHIVPAEEFGNFKLDATQRAPRNLFLPIDRLADAVGHTGQANTLLVRVPERDHETERPRSTERTNNALRILQRALANVVQLEDLGLRLRTDEVLVSVALESSRMALAPEVVAAAEQAAADLGIAPIPTVVYLANSIRVGDDEVRSIPYSTVAALPFEAVSPATSFQFRAGSLRGELAEDEILINTWAADDLDCQVGDRVTIEYYVAEPTRPFETAESTFRVRGIVEIEGIAADRSLVPDYPGITNAKRYADWDPPFPMDLRRIRPKDEEYWDKYRATPKAFVSLATAERLWGSRFGKWTALRFELADEVSPEDRPAPEPVRHPAPRAVRAFERSLLARLEPAQLGFGFQPVRAQGLEASAGGTDFGGLFIGFSFFLIAAAAILIALVFRLGVERRAKQVGLLLALGFRTSGVHKLLIAEGLMVAAAGTIAGLAGAVGYAWLVMVGLRTWWRAAVGTSLLRLHVPVTTLAIGAVAGLCLAVFAVGWSLRGLTRSAPRTLLAGGVTEFAVMPRRSRGILRIALLAMGLSAVWCTFALGGDFHDVAPVRFFILGAFTLVASIAWVGGRGGDAAHQSVRGGGLSAIARLGVRNAYRSRTRSVLSIGLVAFATFVIVAVGANRRDSHAAADSEGSWLVAESTIPLLYDFGTREGRRELGFPSESDIWPNVQVYRFRVKEGEDASCLNLYQPKRPRILGVADATLTELNYVLASSLVKAPRLGATSWSILKEDFGGDVIPAIGDANSVKWILHLGLGDTLPIVAEDGRTVNLKVVGLLDQSVFQSELLISEEMFQKLFPSQAGYSFFLIEQKQRTTMALSQLGTQLETYLSDFGFDAAPLSERLAEYHAVENTYLQTFQMLGGLGLMLGTLGLGAVVLRGVLERRGELALLLAVGYRPGALACLVLAETAFLLVIGLFIGTISAALAVAPHLWDRAADVPIGSLSATLLLVLAIGLLSSAAAVRMTRRTPLLPALRSE